MLPFLNNSVGAVAGMAYLVCSSVEPLNDTGESVSALAVKGQAVRAIKSSLNNVASATDITNLVALVGVASAVNNYEMGVGSEVCLSGRDMRHGNAGLTSATVPASSESHRHFDDDEDEAD